MNKPNDLFAVVFGVLAEHHEQTQLNDDKALHLAHEITTEVRRLNGWISVKERLPEFGNYFVHFTEPPGPGEAIAVFSEGFWFIEYFDWKDRIMNNGLMDHLKVTHWMPLPEPPK